MQGRILGFNVSVAHVWADQQFPLQAAGKPLPVEDSYIAAIARRDNLTIATGNADGAIECNRGNPLLLFMQGMRDCRARDR
jgi:predicted nucleic acid-binding protein